MVSDDHLNHKVETRIAWEIFPRNVLVRRRPRISAAARLIIRNTSIMAADIVLIHELKTCNDLSSSLNLADYSIQRHVSLVTAHQGTNNLIDSVPVAFSNIGGASNSKLLVCVCIILHNVRTFAKGHIPISIHKRTEKFQLTCKNTKTYKTN